MPFNSYRKTVLIALLSVVIWSLSNCSQQETKEPPRPIPNQLDLVMRAMHEDAKILKALVEAGSVPDSSILALHRAMYSATPTNPKVGGDIFEGYVGAYLGSLETLMQPGNFNRSGFNQMVENCIACHSTYCTGPIPVIKKLHIPEEDEDLQAGK